MATILKPEISKKNKWWIERERYHELVHFCRQYGIWFEARKALIGLKSRPADLERFETNQHGDPTARCAMAIEYYSNRINMVHKAALEANYKCWEDIVEAVAEGYTYDQLVAKHGFMLVSRREYYDSYRKFFYLLSKLRD